jgi:hypothetical protein
MMAHDPALLAYLAGLFDGEGCLGSRANGRKPKTWTLEIAMTDESLVRLYHDTFGVGTVIEKVLSGWSRKPQWRWRVTGDAAWEVYYALRPYLRLKLWNGEPS